MPDEILFLRRDIKLISSKEELPLFMTVQDVAIVMRINKTKAYELAKSEGFPSMRLGKRIIVPKESFLEWVENYPPKL